MVMVMERRQEESVVVLEDTDSNLGPKVREKMTIIYHKLTWMRSALLFCCRQLSSGRVSGHACSLMLEDIV